MKTPYLIIIDGPNGAGKTTLARFLHSKMKFTAFVHWDTTKKLVSDFVPNKKYHLLAREITIAMTKVYLQNGVSVISEAYWGTSQHIEEFLNAMKGQKMKTFIYQLEAPFEVRAKRAKERWLVGKTKRLLTHAHIKKNDTIYKLKRYKGARVFDTNKLSMRKITNQILKDLR